MRHSILTTAILLASSSIAIVHAANNFDNLFSTYKKGSSEEIEWKDFATTDLVTLSVLPQDGKTTFSIPLSKCADKDLKPGFKCPRFVNEGRYKIDPALPAFSALLNEGSTYYFELEYIERTTSINTGKSRSKDFKVEAASSSSSSSSKSGSSSSKKKKGGKGKLGKGGIIGICVGVAVVFAILAVYMFKAAWGKMRNKGSSSSSTGLGGEDHEMGKQADDPLMGQDGRIKNTTVWSADVPDDHSRPVEAGLLKYEPYKATGAAAEYYNEPLVKPTGNSAGPIKNDRY